jgi:hypothetical protein
VSERFEQPTDSLLEKLPRACEENIFSGEVNGLKPL